MDGADKIVDQAQKILNRTSVDGYEIYLNQSFHFEIESKDGKIETLQADRYLGIALRVLNHQRMGFSYTTFLNPSPYEKQGGSTKLDRIIEDAIKSAGAASPDPCFDLTPVLKNSVSPLPIFY
jgi:predicted Zn-dependent protease